MKKGLVLFGAALILVSAGLLVAIFTLASQKEALIQKRIKSDLGALSATEIQIEGLRLEKSSESWKRAVIKIQKIEIKNPTGFTSPNLTVLKNVQIDFDPLSLMLGRWRILKLSAEVDKTYIESDQTGGINLAKIPALQTAQPGKAPESSAGFEVRRLELKLGKVYYLDPKNVPNGKETFTLDGKLEVFDHVSDPGILFQAPALSFINKLNKGSLGLSRGLIQEHVKRHIGTPD